MTVPGGVLALIAAICLSAGSLVYGAESAFTNSESVENFQEIEASRGLPMRGTSSQTVLSQYGEPLKKSGPVGDPPISTWTYEEFKVYFEHHLVITTVATEDRLPVRLRDIQ